MRIEKICLLNYRQYKKAEFYFNQQVFDIHVIIAKNGVGKTNLLNAITWCLYEEEPHLGNKYGSLPRYNLDTVEDIKASNEESKIVVEIHAKDEAKTIIFTRSATFKANHGGVVELPSSFKVSTRNGDEEVRIFENELAKRYIDLYLPQRIREYFFFDGEQLDSYFKTENSGQIKDAIYSISQVDIINRVAQRLYEVARSKRNELAKLSPSLEPIILKQEQLIKSIHEIEERKQKLQKLEREAKIRIDTITEELRGQEDLVDIEDKRNKLLAEKESVTIELIQEKHDFVKFVRDMTVNLAYYKASKKIIEIIDKKREEKKLPPDIDKALIEKMLEEHKCAICGHVLNDENLGAIYELLGSYSISSETSHLLVSIRSELNRVTLEAENFSTQKKKFTDRLKKMLETQKRIDIELQKIENEIQKFTEKELILSKYKERDQLDISRSRTIESIGFSDAELLVLKKELDKVNDEYRLAMKKEQKCGKLKKVIALAERANKVATELEESMMFEMKQKMEEKTTEIFLNLIWKKHTYQAIHLDDSYQLDLIHREGYSSLGSASAAERCLLALSFTLALHEVSGFNVMLFIDTPVARISDENRSSFAEKLKEIGVNKQILLTFTPNEFSDEVENVFTPTVASFQELITNEREIVTNVLPR